MIKENNKFRFQVTKQKVTVEELIDYVLKNKNHRTFTNYTPEQIDAEFRYCADHGIFMHSKCEGHVDGVFTGTYENGTFEVVNIITHNPNFLFICVDYILNKYPMCFGKYNFRGQTKLLTPERVVAFYKHLYGQLKSK